MMEKRMAVADVAAAEAKSELHEFLTARDERKRLMIRALLVGLASGGVAVAFRAILAAADTGRTQLVQWSHRFPGVGWLFPVLYSAFGAGIAFLIMRYAAPETGGSGIPHLEAVLRRHRVLRWPRVLIAKFLGGTFSIAAGLALGREGPTVQMGGASGMGVAKLLKSTKREQMVLTAAGAGAGLTAAFNAPLSGVIFVLEELQRDFRPMVLGAAFVAAATADVVTRVVAGQLPTFAVPAYAATSLALLPAYAVLGGLAGLLGVAFNKCLLRALDMYAKVPKQYGVYAAAVTGAAVGLVAYFAPDAVGGGHSVANQALDGSTLLAAIPLLLLLRFVLTIFSYGTGVAGGIFAPLLALGALLGLGVGETLGLMFPGHVPHPAVFAVVGMGACFTAIVRAPLTGIVLIVEMTSSYEQMLPLLVACFAAYATAEALRDLPIYEALLERDLLRGGMGHVEGESTVLEAEVQPGAPFDGKRVRDLGLPAGVVLVMCRDGSREWVPNASTMIEGYQKLTALIAADAQGGREAFWHGVTAD
jgi:CIC family chloride channel protein